MRSHPPTHRRPPPHLGAVERLRTRIRQRIRPRHVITAAGVASFCTLLTTLQGTGVTHLPALPSRSTAPACGVPPPVYHPQRLKLLDPCATFHGRVVAVIQERYDADTHIWATPDPDSQTLLNPQDLYQGLPAMVLEISPACTFEPASAQAAHLCPPSPIQAPSVGDHITALGPENLDEQHGWNELHPITQLTADYVQQQGNQGAGD